MSKKPKKQEILSGNEIDVVSSFKYGYRNREDITNLPPGVLIVGSQNVLTNVSDRIQIRQGYALDGTTSTVGAAILGSYDFNTFSGEERHLRSGFLTSAGNDGKLQYRYEDSNGNITWRDLMTAQPTSLFRFTNFWKTSESKIVALFVNGTSNIYEWNGAITTVTGGTANTITKSGTTTWAQEGFYQAGNKTIVINGTNYTYTGGETTTTLTGVSPSAASLSNGDIAHQAVVTTANSSITVLPDDFLNHLILTKDNRVYVGADNDVRIYGSKVNDYTDFTEGGPPRPVGGGILVYLDDVPNALVVQEDKVYISAGNNYWYTLTATLSADLQDEAIQVTPLKTTPQQAALSQEFVSHRKNDVVMITHEPTMDTLGRVEQILGTPQTMNLSDPIKLDFDSYDFTDGSIYYYKYYILVAVPAEGVVRLFNLNTQNWEAPLTLPISRFYIVEGELYGHSYNTSESYKLFTGYADRVYSGHAGFPISAKAVFSYQNYGTRADLKKANAFYMEGYISPNTSLSGVLTYEIDGCAKTNTFNISGIDTQIVCILPSEGSLGKVSLGKQKLGGDITPSLTGLPPKFRVIKTFPNYNFFEVSMSFSILGVDQRFELIGFGLNAKLAPENPVYITQ